MISRLVKMLAASVKKQLAPQKIQAIFSRLPSVPVSQKSEDICVCALQMEIRAYQNVEQWLRYLDAILAQAAEQGSELVCLPEFYGMMPLLCHWAVAPAVKGMAYLPASSGNGGEMPDVAPILDQISFLMPAYEQIICRFARRYGIYLYGGTGFVLDKGKCYNRGFLVSPEGKILARQDKIHLTEEEMAMGITPGDTMQIIPTPIGNIALSVCMDATYFETFRIAKNLGADYIIVPIGDMAEFDPCLALRGAQMRVNETGLAAVKPALVSAPGFPVPFSGKAGIYFPDSTGFVSAESSDPRKAGMVISRFSLSGLRNSKSKLFRRSNSAFDAHYRETLISVSRSRENNLIKGERNQ